MVKIVQINNTLRYSLQETLDRNDKTNKTRPYYYGVSYGNYMIFIPLRSHCQKVLAYPFIIRKIKKIQVWIFVK